MREISIYPVFDKGQRQPTISVSWKMVKGYALTEVGSAIIKSFPVEIEIEVMLHINAYIGACGDRPERRT
jgi:DNA-binding PadR family transcriptional regulator